MLLATADQKVNSVLLMFKMLLEKYDREQAEKSLDKLLAGFEQEERELVYIQLGKQDDV